MAEYTEDGFPVVRKQSVSVLESILIKNEEGIGSKFVQSLEEENPIVRDLLELAQYMPLLDKNFKLEEINDIKDSYREGVYAVYNLVEREIAFNRVDGSEVNFNREKFTKEGIPKVT